MKTLTTEDIAKIVYSYLDQDIDKRSSPTKKQEFVYPKQLTMYFADKYSNQSQKKIGSYFSRDHATVIHSRKVIRQYIETDRRKKSQIAELKDLILDFKESRQLEYFAEIKARIESGATIEDLQNSFVVTKIAVK